ncbi:MAG: VWA domain-containing protein [Clostridium sp.]|nr:VWA domain-containing protein [Clostridium sp.]MCM1207664.1 VWA domain-containing protein [Ruminococcus sp.]
MNDRQDIEHLNRWRLLLGKYASGELPFGEDGSGIRYMEMEDVLDFLYAREYGENEGVRQQTGGDGGSSITISEWINKIRELFPKETVEIMEKQALDRYGMTELLTDKRVLERLEPNQELLKTILQLKGSMNQDVLMEAKKIVRHVVDELTEKLRQDIRQAIVGRVDRTRTSTVKSSKNLDMKKTIQKNLKNYDSERKRLVLERVYFNARVKKYNTWRVIIAVDESGSMLDSVIHSAVMAGIFAGLPMLDTKLVIFDTNVVDLSDYADDPVETLMTVQLGGGTNIGGALDYCERLIENPERTIVVLITDLYEGGDTGTMYSVTKGMIEAGCKMIVLTALDMAANPNYSRGAAAMMAQLGAHVAAMTPMQLADWVAEVVA